MIIEVKTSVGKYDIVLERGALKRAGEYLNLDRKVLIVTDTGVPKQYSQTVADACKDYVLITVPQGEQNKNFDTLRQILQSLTENSFTRTDCVVAVGGGVVGDMAGFAAAIYMRGIDFYNIPTTVLSQVDSSIGGKTAVDFMGYKNIVGAFYQPKCVIIDSDTLSTLPKRQISNGLAESVKMALTSDSELFEIFEKGDAIAQIDTVIEKSLYIKRAVVMEDEKEAGLRKILNFGHTVGHAIESADGMENYYHGECVAMGMLPMCSSDVRERLIPVLKSLDLPYKYSFDADVIINAARHDKKKSGGKISIVTVDTVGSFNLTDISFEKFEEMIRKAGGTL